MSEFIGTLMLVAFAIATLALIVGRDRPRVRRGVGIVYLANAVWSVVGIPMVIVGADSDPFWLPVILLICMSVLFWIFGRRLLVERPTQSRPSGHPV